MGMVAFDSYSGASVWSHSMIMIMIMIIKLAIFEQFWGFRLGSHAQTTLFFFPLW